MSSRRSNCTAVNSEPYYLAIPLVGAYQESLGMNHNLLGSANEAHFLVDDAGRPHLDKVVRGESLGQVLATAGYDPQSLLEGFHADGDDRGSASQDQRGSSGSLSVRPYQSTLDSYTYLED